MSEILAPPNDPPSGSGTTIIGKKAIQWAIDKTFGPRRTEIRLDVSYSIVDQSIVVEGKCFGRIPVHVSIVVTRPKSARVHSIAYSVCDWEGRFSSPIDAEAGDRVHAVTNQIDRFDVERRKVSSNVVILQADIANPNQMTISW